MNSHPSNRESLRLMLAFFCIMQADRRVEVIQLAERLATDSIADGLTHVSVPEPDAAVVSATDRLAKSRS